MNILHIAYSLQDSSAATRLAKAQEGQHKIFFLLGRLSKSNYIRERQVNSYASAFLGVAIHIFEKVLFKIFQIVKDEIFSFGVMTALQNILVKNVIKYKKIDVIHLHWGGYGFFPLHAACNLDIPIVITAHDYHFFTGGCHIPMDCDQYDKQCQICPLANNKIGQKAIIRIRKRNGETLKKIKPIITAPSNYTRKKINEAHSYLNIKVVGNTLGDIYMDSNLYSNIRKSLYFDYRFKNNDIPTIISVGSNKSTRENKGQDILEFVLLDLIKNDIKFNYISIGKYHDYAGISNRVHFDEIGSQELKKMYSLCDLCLVTSRFETFSQVALESIICGTPVIAFNNSGPNDIILPEKTGFLVPAFDINAFIKITKENIDFKYKNIDEIYKNASETAQRFSSENIICGFDGGYADALDQFKKARETS